MRTSVVALALTAALAAPALAQQGNTGNPASPNAPPSSMAPATQPPGTTAAPGTTTGPAASPTRPGTATSAAPGTTSGTTAPAARSDGSSGLPTTVTPAAGANSFTEGQARSRIEEAGYTGVQELRKDDAGVWRGRAMRGGQTVDVGLDFRGNVVTGNAPAR
jgi:hypothetical protein